MKRALPGAFALLALMLACPAVAQERVLPRAALRSGIDFAGADVRAMQADDFANPGMLWVERGEALWKAAAGAQGRSCASCHGDAPTSMRGVATRYPAWDPGSRRVIDLEGRIQACRREHQDAPMSARGSDPLLALAAYVAYQSRGLPLKVDIEGAARPAFERGRLFYYARHGQMNIACAQCHEQHWGKHLLVETISQGHGTAYPAYRLEWQALGSLGRRLRACLFGIRAEMPDEGAPELVELAFFLAWRAEGLPLEAPGVRR